MSGQSIACTAPSGCSGGQVCKSDGTGYDPCICADAAGGTGGSGGAAGSVGTGGTGTGGSGGAAGVDSGKDTGPADALAESDAGNADAPIDTGPCVKCNDAVTNGADSSRLCAPSKVFYDALNQCMCVDSCPTECAELCNGGASNSTCQSCYLTKCGSQIVACQNDA